MCRRPRAVAAASGSRASRLAAKPEKLIINRGTRDGVSVGIKFDICKVEEVVDDDTGEVIDSSMTKLGTVTVTEVKEKVAYTTPLEGAEKGMGVHPAK